MAVKKATTTLTTYDALGDEAKAIMDRAVRKARTSYWCDRFDEAAPAIFNVKPTDVVDSDGFSCRGYNREGFNKDGYNRDGYNAEGFNESGFDKNGYDKDGFDRLGVNKAGVDRQGRDKYRYDTSGYDQEGFDSTGQRARRTREWYAKQAAKPETDFVFDYYGNRRPAAPAKKATVRKAATPKVPVARRAGSKLIDY